MLQEEAKELLEIEKREGGIRTESVLAAARNEDSSLHHHFEWEDTVAGENYRLFQARQLIRNVKIIVKNRPTNQFYNIKVRLNDDKIESLYHSYDVVVKNKPMVEQLKQNAVREQKYWIEKYKEIDECMEIVNQDALDKLEKKVTA